MRRRETIAGLLLAGFTADSARAAVAAEDLSLLRHTGRFAVKLDDLPGDRR